MFIYTEGNKNSALGTLFVTFDRDFFFFMFSRLLRNLNKWKFPSFNAMFAQAVVGARATDAFNF